MAPDIKPTPPEERQTFRWTAGGTIPGYSKADAAEQTRLGIAKAISRLGGTVTGCAVSNHMELGGRE